MLYDEFLTENRYKILGYLMLSEMLNKQEGIETPCPPAELSEEFLEEVKWWLNQGMPLDNMIIDLWDWDIHFEKDLSEDWYFESIFGAVSSVDSCAKDLAEYFIAMCDEYALDYGQGPGDKQFEDLVWEQSVKFIKDWRKNVFARCEKAISIKKSLAKLNLPKKENPELEKLFKEAVDNANKNLPKDEQLEWPELPEYLKNKPKARGKKDKPEK